jgi:hypothetical protein
MGIGIAVEIGNRKAAATPNPIATPMPIPILVMRLKE